MFSPAEVVRKLNPWSRWGASAVPKEFEEIGWAPKDGSVVRGFWVVVGSWVSCECVWRDGGRSGPGAWWSFRRVPDAEVVELIPQAIVYPTHFQPTPEQRAALADMSFTDQRESGWRSRERQRNARPEG